MLFISVSTRGIRVSAAGDPHKTFVTINLRHYQCLDVGKSNQIEKTRLIFAQ